MQIAGLDRAQAVALERDRMKLDVDDTTAPFERRSIEGAATGAS